MSGSPMETFRARMKETRESRGVTLKQIAEHIGCKEATVQRYESGNGIKSVPYNQVVAIAEYLGVTPQYLMGWESPNVNDAEIHGDILSDRTLMEYAKKIYALENDDRKMIYSYIDYICSKKEIRG